MTGSCSDALSPFEDDRKPPAKGRTPYFASPDDDASVSSRIDVEPAAGTVFAYSEEDYLDCINRYTKNPGLGHLCALSDNKKKDRASKKSPVAPASASSSSSSSALATASASASAITVSQFDTSRKIFVHERE